ncbi:hypothetical protein SAMD00019534_121140 [Acytostelium subglobosum LB1]|uniref:hypothetical protein n=1 Tax=Acytostelium subglobosum LB1 TaxID=1410327 RepID=UPI000644D51D|nr:hypothetical protein SAMD00019534_121140 [Acytostelium subglobosum LB1]GAM28938.1 hypothetical protein SAMD00019534_121140 [Acytostelium subglobosum LB1]|eukprot:XP_012748123.1 hypothetical protein SAMD00019534_121140 [Acytostelium subglobosum LB1]
MKYYLTILAFLALILSVSASSYNDSDNSSSCSQKTSCSDCTDDHGCVWCEGAGECHDGTFYGSKPITYCRDFRWMQCKMDGVYTLLISVAVALVLIALIITAIKVAIYFCCCARKRSTKPYTNIQEEDESRSLLTNPSQSVTPVTDKRREEFRMKYGIGKQTSTSSWD